MSQKERLMIAAIFTLAATFSAMDLTADYREGSSGSHLIFEAMLFLASISGIIYLLRLWWKARKGLAVATHHLSETRADFQEFKIKVKPYLEGLGKMIDTQLASWELSNAEKDIALLILKGLSFKEIADIRKTSERTVRQQARSIYARAKLSGRAEFSAFFLEDLLLPYQAPEEP